MVFFMGLQRTRVGMNVDIRLRSKPLG